MSAISTAARISGESLREQWPLILFFIVLGVVSWLLCDMAWLDADTWSYIELSRSIREGHYNLRAIRSFVTVDQNLPSKSFPPLYPLALAFVDFVTGAGPRAGIILNVFECWVFVGLSEAIGRRLTGVRWIGLAASAFVFLIPGFKLEVWEPRSHPMQMAHMALLLLLALRWDGRGRWLPSVIGVVCGLLILCRTDALPFSLVFLVGLTVLWSPRVAPLFCAGVAAALAPWVAFSLAQHGTPFASDNSWVALSTDPHAFVTDWHAPGKWAPTAMEQPAHWLLKIYGNIWPLARSLAFLGLPNTALFWMGAVIFLGLLRLHRAPAVAHVVLTDAQPKGNFGSLSVFTIAVIAMLPTYLLVGYFDPRYFVPLYWVGALWLGQLVVLLWSDGIKKSALEHVAVAATGLALVILVSWANIFARETQKETFSDLAKLAGLKNCLDKAGPGQSRVLMINDQASRSSALFRIDTALLPANFARIRPETAELAIFFRVFGIGYVEGSPQDLNYFFQAGALRPAGSNCGSDVYEIVFDN